MSKRPWSVGVIGAAMLGILACVTARGANNAPAAAGGANIELAEQLESMAYAAVNNVQILPAVWRQSAVLLRAAQRLNPKEPRYARELYTACVNGHDPDGALAALNSYLTMVPDDQVAQAYLIDMYLDQMQTADAMLKYAQSLISKAQLPPAVRARAAVRCAQTLLDRSQKAEAIKMLSTAIQIQPLCVSALRMKLQLTGDEGPSRRVGLLLEIIRADPMDARAEESLAGELADLGMPAQSANWYLHAKTLYQAEQQPLTPEFGKGLSVGLYLYNKASDAALLISQYLEAVPSDTEAWMIYLAIAKDTISDPGQYQALVHKAVNAATTRLQAVRANLGGANVSPPPPAPANPAATQPLMATPDLSNDSALLVKADQPQLTDDYISAVGDLAWLRLCFLRDGGDDTQRLIDGLSKLLADDDPLLARLNGWAYLLRGQWDEARLKLSAVADRDAYAQMGMVYIDDQAGKRADADNLARAVLAAHPSGAEAAILYSAFHGRGAAIVPLPQAQLVSTELQQFPDEWRHIVENPQLFYTISAEPLEQQVPFPHPILVKVTIQNVSDFDITMGPEGTLHPLIVFDATTHGLVEQVVGQTVFEEFWQRLVLPKGQYAAQIVRLDRGDLENLLNAQPDLPIDIQFSMLVNPMRVPGRTDYVIGGCGCRVALSGLIERAARPYKTADDRKKLYDVMAGADQGARLDAVTAMATFAQAMRGQAKGVVIDQSYSTALELMDHLKTATTDADPAVRGWASYLQTVVSSSAQPGTSPTWYCNWPTANNGTGGCSPWWRRGACPTTARRRPRRWPATPTLRCGITPWPSRRS
jgi:hypothetical protein